VEWQALQWVFGSKLLIKPIFHPATFLRTEQQPTDLETSAPLHAILIRQRLGFLLHPTVGPLNPAFFSSNLLEPEVPPGLIRRQNETQPRCGLMRSTF